MYNSGQPDERIICIECWKGYMVEVELHVYVKIIGEESPDPLILTQYFCDECQILKAEL